MKGIRFAFLSAVMAALCAGSARASEYYWNVASGTWGSYGDTANWLVGGPGGTAATSVPGETDSLCPTQNFFFALGGVTNKVGTWKRLDNDWGTYKVSVTNGTLLWKTLYQTHGATVSIYDGATFTFDPSATFNASQSAGASTYVNVYSNGLFDLNGATFVLYHLTLKNYAGGTTRLPYQSISFSANEQSSDIENNGTMSLPSGIAFVNSVAKTALNIKQNAGTMTLGGDVTLNGGMGTLTVLLNGGTLQATTNVSIAATSASVPADKSVTVDVAANSYLDMSVFTYGTGSSLTKTGAGTLRLGANLPSTLTVSAGDIGLYGANSTINLSSASLPEGTRVTFGATGITLSTVPAGVTLSYRVDTSTIAQNVVFLTCTNAALLAQIKSDIAAALPESVGVEEVSGSLKLVPVTPYVFNSTTVTDWNNPTGWVCGYVPTNQAVLVKGAGVTARITAAIPAVASIQVLDGATLSIETAFDCPPVTLTGPCTLALANSAAVALTNGLTCVAASAATMPVLSIPTGSRLNVPAGMTFGNVFLQIGGTLATTGSGHMKLGYAKTSEVTYFGLAATNATITWSNSGFYQLGDLMIACPESGGTVIVPNVITLKSCTLPTGNWNNLIGLRIGINNPTGNLVNVVMDGTRFRRSSSSTISGGAVLTLTNGASFYTADEPNTVYPLEIAQRGQAIVYSGSSLEQYIANAGQSPLTINPDELGFQSLVLHDGTLRVFATSGNGKGTLYADGGTFKVFAYKADNDTCTPFRGLSAVKIGYGKTLALRGDAAASIGVTLADVPFTGGGSIAVTNAAADYTFSVTVSNGANTATGYAECATNASLLFNNGANWAGTVIADGTIALTNTASADLPSTNRFGGLQLSGPFAIRVGAGGLCDRLDLTDGFVNDGGALALRPFAGYTLDKADKFAFAGLPDSGDRALTLPACSAAGWSVAASADPDKPGYVILRFVSGSGTVYRLE